MRGSDGREGLLQAFFYVLISASPANEVDMLIILVTWNSLKHLQYLDL